MTNSLTLIFSSFIGFLQIYLILLLVRVSLTWFPNVNWYAQPFYSLSRLTDPYLKIFRGIVPPINWYRYLSYSRIYLIAMYNANSE